MMTRIKYLDYIRGIAIFMVVMGHVLNFGIGLTTTALKSLTGICEMPFFFIVSGYLAYKQIENPKIESHIKKFIKRTAILLIPMVTWSFIHNITYLSFGS